MFSIITGSEWKKFQTFSLNNVTAQLWCNSVIFYDKSISVSRKLDLNFVQINKVLKVSSQKTNISCHFCIISKLFSLGEIIFYSAVLNWILLTSSENLFIFNKKEKTRHKLYSKILLCHQFLQLVISFLPLVGKIAGELVSLCLVHH